VTWPGLVSSALQRDGEAGSTGPIPRFGGQFLTGIGRKAAAGTRPEVRVRGNMLGAKPFPNCASLKEKGSAEFDKQPRQGKALRRGQATGFLE
jgi:hypothetical protein